MTPFEEEQDKKIQEQNKKIVHYIFTIFWSMVTAVLICYLYLHK